MFVFKLRMFTQSKLDYGMPWLCSGVSFISRDFVLYLSILGELGYPSSQLPDNRTIQNFVEDYVEEYIG